MDLSGLLVDWISHLGGKAVAQLAPQTEYALQNELQSACQVIDTQLNTAFGDTLSSALARSDVLNEFAYVLVLASKLGRQTELAHLLEGRLPLEIHPSLTGTDATSYLATLAENLDRQIKVRSTVLNSPLFNWYVVLTAEAESILSKERHDEVVGAQSHQTEELIRAIYPALRGTLNSADAILPEIDRVAHPDTRASLLPVPSEETPDVLQLLLSGGTPNHNILTVIIGPQDSGKTTLLRTLRSRYHGYAELYDLAADDPSSMGKIRAPRPVLLVDHLDRIVADSGFSVAYQTLDRTLPALCHRGVTHIYLAIESTWRRDFRRLYQTKPESFLAYALPNFTLRLHQLRPYSDTEMLRIAADLHLDPHQFDDPELRLAGVVALERAVSDEPGSEAPTTLRSASQRIRIARRWINSSEDMNLRERRHSMWQVAGESQLSDANSLTAFSSPVLTNGRDVGVPWTGPAWLDAAAGDRIFRFIVNLEGPPALDAPIRRSILYAVAAAAVESPDFPTLVHQHLKQCRGSDANGYLGAILATILLDAVPSPAPPLTELVMRGLEDRHLSRIPPAVVDQIRNKLEEMLDARIESLVARLVAIPATVRSARYGGNAIWKAARHWTFALGTRSAIERIALEAIPVNTWWRFEDLLNVSVVNATTHFMAKHEVALVSALKRLPDRVDSHLCDLWDGINDGLWDSVDRYAQGFVASLVVAPHRKTPLVFDGCSLQRAHLGPQDVSDWSFRNCDLLLADMRSCRGIAHEVLEGSNWWDAILAPADRYRLSENCNDERFFDWCAEPPWSNPYYVGRWPRPQG